MLLPLFFLVSEGRTIRDFKKTQIFSHLLLQFSGAAVTVVYQCWMLPCLFPPLVLQSPLLPMDFTVLPPSSWGSRAHCWLGSLPALCAPLKKNPNKQRPHKTPQKLYISIFLILLVLWSRFCQQLQKLPSLHLNSRNSPLFGSQIKSNCCLFHCPDKFFINCVRSLWGRERRKRKKKAVEECRLGKVPTINGVAVTSGYLKIHRCQLPGGFCCLWQLVIVIGRLLLCTS